METGTSIYGKVMKRVGINLPVDPHCLINCHGTTVYQLLDKLWHIVNTSVGVYDENAKALEEFTKNVAEWAAEFQAQIIALVQGGGDNLGVIGWNSLTAELKEKINSGEIKSGEFKTRADGKTILLLRTTSTADTDITIELPDGLFGGGDMSKLNDLTFELTDDGGKVGLNYQGNVLPLFTIPFAGPDKGELTPGAPVRTNFGGLMTWEQFDKLNKLEIKDGVLKYDGVSYRLEPLHTVKSTDYSDIVLKVSQPSTAAATPQQGQTSIKTVISYSYSQIKTVTYNEEGAAPTITELTSGAAVTIEANSEYIDHVEGNVIYWKENTTESKRSANVKVKVAMNGKTAEKDDLTIWQNAADVRFMIGNTTATLPQFSALSTDELVSQVALRSISQGTKNSDGSYTHTVNCTGNTYYVMYPVEKIDVIGATLASEITSNFTAAEIANSAYWRATHDNVTIDGVEYAVRGYWASTSLSGAKMSVTVKQK